MKLRIVNAATITSSMVRDAARACKDHSKARAIADDAERTKKQKLLELMLPLLGITKEDEIAQLSPQQLRDCVRRRIREGSVKLEKPLTADALVDAIEKTSERAVPAYKALLIAQLGEARALELTAQTPTSYYYKVVEPACLQAKT